MLARVVRCRVSIGTTKVWVNAAVCFTNKRGVIIMEDLMRSGYSPGVDSNKILMVDQCMIEVFDTNNVAPPVVKFYEKPEEVSASPSDYLVDFNESVASFFVKKED